MPERSPGNFVHWLFGSRDGAPGRLVPRWIFLRALAAIYFSAFYSLLFQIKGLIGPEGILPAQEYLAAVAQQYPSTKLWFAPTLFWLSANSHALLLATWIGLVASIAAFCKSVAAAQLLHLLRLLPFLCVGRGRILELSIRRNVARSRIHRAILRSARLAARAGASGAHRRAPACFCCNGSGSASTSNRAWSSWSAAIRQWRHFTAMDEYYQNGPLPTWIGWYVEHLPHWFHAATAAGTLVMELVLVWMLFLPATRAHCLLLHRHAVGNRRHSHRQLHVPELPGALAGIPFAG